MIVRWENKDLTEDIKKVLPAFIELASINGEQRFLSPNMENSSQFAEAICCILMTFFLKHNISSLIVVQEDNDFIYFHGYLIRADTYEKEIVLSYKVLPDKFFEQYF